MPSFFPTQRQVSTSTRHLRGSAHARVAKRPATWQIAAGRNSALIHSSVSAEPIDAQIDIVPGRLPCRSWTLAGPARHAPGGVVHLARTTPDIRISLGVYGAGTTTSLTSSTNLLQTRGNRARYILPCSSSRTTSSDRLLDVNFMRNVGSRWPVLRRIIASGGNSSFPIQITRPKLWQLTQR